MSASERARRVKVIRFEGNCTASVVRQAKYRLKRYRDKFQVEIVIETNDGERLYPASREHADLVKMVNDVKREVGGGEGGQFYINEYHQVIVPAGDPVEYYYAGEYHHDIILKLDDEEFSGRPLHTTGDLLKPGDAWSGRPRPGIKYKLKAGGTDIEFEREITPGRNKVVRLSKVVGEANARQTARKIASIKGNTGGPFYINEYRALFGPVHTENGTEYLFIGILTDDDSWFPKWNPAVTGPNSPGSKVEENLPPVKPELEERTIEIEDGARGYSFEGLFADYLWGAKVVTVEDPYIVKGHQLANFLRFCELCVRLGAVREIRLITSSIPNDNYARLISLQKSLKSFGIDLQFKSDGILHDRQISTDTGWCIHLGRGLDIYKKPEDFNEVGVSDFELRPCHKTRLIYKRHQPTKVSVWMPGTAKSDVRVR